jgi:DNA-binding response OmpR family regulator
VGAEPYQSRVASSLPAILHSPEADSVHPASDGKLALRFVRSILPDLILLDIKMPGVDGYEVCRRLKADERTRTIPIIFISILEDEGEKVKGFHAGAVDYITKPFQPEEVMARVRLHLRLRELTEHLENTVAARIEELMLAQWATAARACRAQKGRGGVVSLESGTASD